MHQKPPIVKDHFNKAKDIYLDYAATTPAHTLVLAAFKRAAIKYYGNPNSAHALGLKAANEITKSLRRIRLLLGLPSHYELIPTSGATESNNLALKGIALQYGKFGKTIITTAFEHPSVIASANYLAKQGFNVKIAPSNQWGRVDINELEKLIDDDTILVSVGSINSEIGIRQPIAAIKTMLRQHPKVFFHVDATQSIGKENIDLNGVDLISMAAHKFYGLKGVGLLIKSKRTQLTPIIHGGHSTTLIRRGTPTTELIVSMEKALRIAMINFNENNQNVININRYIREKLNCIKDIIINSTPEDLPYILNISILGKESRSTIKYMSDHGIYISNHTACDSETNTSITILTLTGDKKRADSSVRLSFSYLTTIDEIDRFITILKEYIA
jgi:cysteine desulfurase